MNILIDTHILLWVLRDSSRINGEVRRLIAEPSSRIMFSAASIWEISIKAALEREDFRVSPSEILESAKQSGFVELPITSAVTLRVADLPLHHRDPFDRLLVAQAMAEPARLYTADRRLAAYSELVTLV